MTLPPAPDPRPGPGPGPAASALADHLRRGPVYLDYNATTPVDPAVVASMMPFLQAAFGNPASRHAYGRAAAAAVTDGRERVAALLGAPDPAEIVFTGSGSEANALALRGALLPALRAGRRHLVTQATEHPSVLRTCHALARDHGARVTRLPVDGHGLVDPDALRASLTDDTALVSIQLANGETGTIQPVPELAALAHEAGALFHTDAAQAVGRIPVDVRALGVDLLTLVGHKCYAPKGIAALYVRSGLHLEPLVHGGGQEHARRAGTENVAAIVGLGTAADLAARLLPSEPPRLAHLRDTLHQRLAASLPGRVHLNGHPTLRTPNTLNISIDGLAAAAFLAGTDAFAASTASACHAGRDTPSDVLTAMGIPQPRALSALRLSLGRWTDDEDIDRTVAAQTRGAR